MLKYIYIWLLGIITFIYTTFVYGENISLNTDKIIYLWNNHQKSLLKISSYQIHGDCIYSVNYQKKIYMQFLWTQYDNNHYSIKLLNLFGLTIISISVQNAVVYIKDNILYQNYNLKNKIQQWLINTDDFQKQIQQWILGLPGRQTKFKLNTMGCLSNVVYHYKDEDISIFYRLYDTNNVPLLPAILEIYYGQYAIMLNINYWNIHNLPMNYIK